MRVWNDITRSFNLRMAIPRKRQVGTSLTWLGFNFYLTAGIVTVAPDNSAPLRGNLGDTQLSAARIDESSSTGDAVHLRGDCGDTQYNSVPLRGNLGDTQLSAARIDESSTNVSPVTSITCLLVILVGSLQFPFFLAAPSTCVANAEWFLPSVRVSSEVSNDSKVDSIRALTK